MLVGMAVISSSATSVHPAPESADTCSVLRAAAVLGDFWSLGVLRCVVYGMRRYGQFQRELGIATNVLAARLSHLVETGVLVRARYQDRPPRDEYLLTPAGRELAPIVLALKAWGDAHLQPEGPYTVARHRGCDGGLEIVMRCPDCGSAVGSDEIDTVVVRGPSTNARGSSSGSGA